MTPHQRVDILRAACCVAAIDGSPNPAERSVIDRLSKAVGCGDASVNAMIDRAQSDPNFYQQQFCVLKDDPQDSIATLIEVAIADGELKPIEIDVLRGLATNLQIPKTTFDSLIDKVKAMIGGSQAE